MEEIGVKLQKAVLIMMSIVSMLGMSSCENRLDSPCPSTGEGKAVEVSLCVGIADEVDTYHCGLSKAVRKRLQKMGIKRKLPVVFSTEQADPNAVLLTDDEMNKKSTCGTVSYMPAVFGCYLAEYVIKRL